MGGHEKQACRDELVVYLFFSSTIKYVCMACRDELIVYLFFSSTICMYVPYLPVYNMHFFSAKTAPKIEMRIIHGIHCFRHASLISIKTKTHWFLIEK